jgi:thioredoxin-related protein
MKRLLAALFVCCVVGTVWATETDWLTSLPAAQAKAKKESKLVFVDFTGSDWCSWCKKLDAEVFTKSEFLDYAKKNLVLVQLDYPKFKELPADLKKANEELAKKYEINGFPTTIAMKPDGTVVWKNDGYMAGGPSAYIAELDKVKAK